MSNRARLGLLVALGLSLAVGIRPLVARYMAEPLGLSYAVAVRYVESLPQIYLWAGLLAACLVFGVRRIPAVRTTAASELPAPLEYSGRLGEWERLLSDRWRGAYFEWRLAHRLAELQAWIGAEQPAAPDHQTFLEIGRDRRTISAERRLRQLNFELDGLVGYLEDAIDRS